jgi:dihydroxyacid dehydratase/phosphogluconate dehydratase
MSFDGRPIIGICNTWSELTSCNAHVRKVQGRRPVVGTVDTDTGAAQFGPSKRRNGESPAFRSYS